ncbi:hypothetical protein [Pseudomonas psychrophila]|jgi:hypothetical protein|uniref:Uncharacterized protein n=1 Tax=Pseudomonas psychrophila TaxID=122355 RepID=A0ABY0VLQ7_9PSED|nr:hypothetical protein [Pseudomonas psychrophila]EPJ94893.1 hypothetical protein CF149_05999 [Pseudomonas psychrophila]KAB0493085.1 hypothetical protein F7Q95_01445 [Pseudomonas psychrophila]KMN03041.1 hypothetical protein TU76_04635 [Pseudomonas psychrophila]QIE31981.1 hypothetical protein G5J76_06805 [Pseudomonas psychrophila]WVI98533.1 hypothetical protein VR624_03850 [Pseudomonas psychrophila]
MNRFLSLLGLNRPNRCFARLDPTGRCQAFKQCKQPPVGDSWVEIEEIRLNWLHQVLPASARIASSAPRSAVQPLLGL